LLTRVAVLLKIGTRVNRNGIQRNNLNLYQVSLATLFSGIPTISILTVAKISDSFFFSKVWCKNIDISH